MKIGVLYDPQKAGRAVAGGAKKRGAIVVDLMEDGEVDAAYVRTCTFPPWRDRGLKILRGLVGRNVPTVPAPVALKLYDDKAAQAEALKRWAPETRVITDRDRAEAAVDGMAYPFVSKSRRGASSRNVRLINSKRDAREEIAAVFGRGLKCHREIQRGYLIWQDFIGGNDGDIRVCVTGDHLFGLRRFNRPNVPFASGSGRREEIRTLNDEAREAFARSIEIAGHLESRWCCFDFVFAERRAHCLETSFSWVEGAYDACPCFTRDLEPAGITAARWPSLAVDELERAVG